MTDELLEVLTEQGEPTGQVITRNKAHRIGTWHASVHVWLFCQRGVILQKRALNKESFPALYDASASGHVVYGETPKQAAVRETKEELGIHLNEAEIIFVNVCKLIIKHSQTDFISNEFNYIFTAKIDINCSNLKFDDEEIDSIRFIKIEELQKDIQIHDNHYCFNKDELQCVIKAIDFRSQ